ncbi:MAG TPA: L,D-transpeptidase family protein [Candidatus Methylacidiphilales bacterium]
MRFAILLFVALLAWAAPRATVLADEATDDLESRGFANPAAPAPQADRRVVDYWGNRALMPLVWNPDPAQPLTRIEIRLGECKLFVYQGDRLVGATSISPGKEGYDTRPGVYKITQKDKDHRSNMYGSFVDAQGNVVAEATPEQTPPPGTHYEGAPMLWFLRLTDTGTGLHAGYVTGTPVSHGCIRMPPPFAEDLFSLAQVGTTVEVKQ